MKPIGLNHTKSRLNRIVEALSEKLKIKFPIWEAPANNLKDSFYLVERIRKSNGVYVNIFSDINTQTNEWVFIARSNYLDAKEFETKSTDELSVIITKCAARLMWQLIDKTKKRTPK